jgi:Glycosyl transferase family 2
MSSVRSLTVWSIRWSSSTTGAPTAPVNERGEAGALVITEPRRGYGRACRTGVDLALEIGAEVIAFMDGDGSDCPEFMHQIVSPILFDGYDFVIGSRTRGKREKGSLNLQQLCAGRLAGVLLRALYGVRYTDMSPFRAIRAELLKQLVSGRTRLWTRILRDSHCPTATASQCPGYRCVAETRGTFKGKGTAHEPLQQ